MHSSQAVTEDGYREWLAKTTPGVALDISRWQKAGKSPKEIADLLFEHSTIARGMKLAGQYSLKIPRRRKWSH